MTQHSSRLPENVHIIPLGHEIDRAVKPLMKSKVDRVHILAIPSDADFDPLMKAKQTNYTQKVTAHLKGRDIQVQHHAVNMFNILDVMKKISRIIVMEKSMGNNIYVNMSSCGRKTSFAVTIAALVHEIGVYYVAADDYSTGKNADKEFDHGMSIVKSANLELLQQFRIMMPEKTNILLLAELYRRKVSNKSDMKSDDIIAFFNEQKIYGFDKKPEDKRGLEKSRLMRTLLNRINRNHLKELIEQEYIEKRKVGKEFFVKITDAGAHIACVSGLVE